MNGAERGFVAKIIAQKGCGSTAIAFIKQHCDGFSFIPADAELDAVFKRQEAEFFELRNGLEECECPLLYDGGLRGRNAAPVHHSCVWFWFEQSAKCVAMECGVEFIQNLAGTERDGFELASSIGVETLKAMQAPDLDRLIEGEERFDL